MRKKGNWQTVWKTIKKYENKEMITFIKSTKNIKQMKLEQ